jgi:uncharacterized repeat protein (TIGR03803 family)
VGFAGFGIAAISLGALPASAWTYKSLYGFNGGTVDGYLPLSGLVSDASGNMYGTTEYGGSGSSGTVYRITPKGKETVLYAFVNNGQDGMNPWGTLVLDKKGNLYGTTLQGGPGNCGTVFKLSPKGVESVLHAFTGGADGSYPYAGLIVDKAGNLYGAAGYGGNGGGGVCGGYGYGTIFKIAPDGSETVLYAFQGGTDGANPHGGLLADNSGNFFGTTYYGGTSNAGTVFKLDPSGNETVLHSFTGDGAYPNAGLIEDKTGNLYGTTVYGGLHDGCGAVFEIASDGTPSILYSFTCGSDGGYPKSGVVLYKGSLYGTGYAYGDLNATCGSVFELSLAGEETTLHDFQEEPDGCSPVGGLLVVKKSLYGTTSYGGNGTGPGTVFELKK